MYDFVITSPVMAFTEVSAAYKNAVCATDKTIHKKDGIYPAGAHNPDDPHKGWILKAGHPCRISRGIAAPVAKEAKNLRFGLISCHVNPLQISALNVSASNLHTSSPSPSHWGERGFIYNHQ